MKFFIALESGDEDHACGVAARQAMRLMVRMFFAESCRVAAPFGFDRRYGPRLHQLCVT